MAVLVPLMLRWLPVLLAMQDAAPVAGDGAARVDEVLTRLEARGDEVRDIRCAVKYEEEDRLNLTKRTKIGQVLYLVTEPNPLFYIRFDRTAVDDVLGKREWYLFDGTWFYQAVERTRTVTKQRIAKEGERIDLFDIETAPFPMPFGQKKEKILASFDVTLAAAASGPLENCDHLVCVPKAESRMARDYAKLEFFVDRELHLPRRIVITRSGAQQVTVADFPDLSSASINPGLSREEFRPAEEWKGYAVVEEDLTVEQP